MRNGRTRERNLHHLAASHFRTLADAIRHSTGLANADTDTTLIVAYNHNRAEGEAATALDNFSDALNINDAFVKFFTVVVTLTFAAWFTFTTRLVVRRSLFSSTLAARTG